MRKNCLQDFDDEPKFVYEKDLKKIQMIHIVAETWYK